jgi:hypothetical protein
MRVVMLRGLVVGPGQYPREGETADLPDELAKKWIARGWVRPAAEAEPAATPPHEPPGSDAPLHQDPKAITSDPRPRRRGASKEE